MRVSLHSYRKAALAAAAFALVAAGCGSDSSSGEESPAASPSVVDTTDASPAGPDVDEPSDSDDFTLEEPVKFVLLAEIAGESDVAVNDYSNAVTMAVDDINAAGGIGGHDVVLERIPAPLAPQDAVSAFLDGAERGPAVILGFPANFQVAAAASQIDQAGIPFVSLANVEPTVVRSGELGSPWIYQLRAADNVRAAQENARFAIEELGATRLGVQYVDVASSPPRVEAVKEEAERLGAEVVVERKHALGDTDFIDSILAMKSAEVDAIVNISFPNDLAAQLEQYQQNDLAVPVVTTTSAETVVVNELASSDALDNLYGNLDCNVREQSPDWAQRYEERYDVPASTIGGGSYDAVWFAAEAVRHAQATDPESVRAAMEELEYTDGVCSTNMYADDDGVLQHGTVLVRFTEDAHETIHTYE